MRFSQARILEWVAISFSRRSSQPRDWTWVSHIVGRCFTVWATWKVHYKWYFLLFSICNKLYRNITDFNILFYLKPCFSSVQFSRSLVSDSLRPHGLQHARLPCPSPTHETLRLMSIKSVMLSIIISSHIHAISSSAVPFSTCLQSFPASGSFPMSQFFASSGQSIGLSASASVLPMNIQDWFPLGLTGWISLQSRDSTYWLVLGGFWRYFGICADYYVISQINNSVSLSNLYDILW